MKAGRLFILALHSPEIKIDETAELIDWIRENDDLLPEALEDLKLSRLDLDGMEQDFLSITGSKIS
jgi:hypothetical protein